MQIITIILGTEDDGAPFAQVISSDGIDPADAVRACQRAVNAFQSAAIEAEVQRRVEAALGEKPTEEAEQ